MQAQSPSLLHTHPHDIEWSGIDGAPIYIYARQCPKTDPTHPRILVGVVHLSTDEKPPQSGPRASSWRRIRAIWAQSSRLKVKGKRMSKIARKIASLSGIAALGAYFQLS